MMIDDDTQPSNKARMWRGLNWTLTIALFIAGFWYLTQKVPLSELWQALANARIGFITLSLAAILATLLLKAWRWQLLFSETDQSPAFSPLFWSMLLGAYLNTLLPFLRLGEVARIFSLNNQTGINKMQSLGTLILEKTLEMIMLGLLLAGVAVATLLPAHFDHLSTTFILSGLAVLALVIFYIFASQPQRITSITQALFDRFLPPTISKKLTRWVATGITGFAALRHAHHALLLAGFSIMITITSVAAPFFLFRAFHISLGLIEAAVIHTAVSLALVPPTTPGKIGILDGVVVFLLLQFGLQNNAAIASYTIVFHLVIIAPLIILGSLAASRTNWKWGKSDELDLSHHTNA